jgi:hypothetical protein
LLGERVAGTLRQARERPELAGDAAALEAAFSELGDATREAWSTGDPETALANATPYLQAFGHVVIAWIWLDVAVAVMRCRDERSSADRADHWRGKLQAARYFFDYELPKISAWLGVVRNTNPTCREMQEEWYFQ